MDKTDISLYEETRFVIDIFKSRIDCGDFDEENTYVWTLFNYYKSNPEVQREWDDNEELQQLFKDLKKHIETHMAKLD